MSESTTQANEDDGGAATGAERGKWVLWNSNGLLMSLFCSNSRSRAPFKPQKANRGTSSWQLKQFAEATLGSGSLRKAVKLPEGEDLSEWLAVNGELVHATLRRERKGWGPRACIGAGEGLDVGMLLI